MSLTDREHFESYRAQTLAKHTILEKYLYAYFIILKGTEDRLVYIDGFAGKGTYTADDGSTVPGSPLRALEKISSNPDLAKKVRTFFIEQDEKLFAQLKATLDAYYAKSPQIREPQLTHGAFSAAMTEMMDEHQRDRRAIAPMFVFVDPCGVDGVDFAVIDNRLCETAYRNAILELEKEGKVLVLGEDGQTPTPKRLRRNGVLTLSERCHVKLT